MYMDQDNVYQIHILGTLSIFSTQIRNNNSIEIFEDGRETRDFVLLMM